MLLIRLQAEGTTLGADNGIGVAAALALLDMPASTKLPPLECLFTIDEETGLTGMLVSSCCSGIYRAAPCTCLRGMSSILIRQGFSRVPTHQQTATTAEQGLRLCPPQVLLIIVTALQLSCECIFQTASS